MGYKFGFPEAAEVVVVDDEHQNLYLFEDQFSSHFNLKMFSDPVVAQSFLRKSKKTVLVVTDQSMPTMKGLELAHSIKRERPYLNFIMVTANPEADKNLMYSSLKHNVFFDFLQKPLDFEAQHVELLKLFRAAAADAFAKYVSLDYTAAAQAFSVTPITRDEHQVIQELISKRFDPGITTDATFSEVQILKSVQGKPVMIASLSKLEDASWTLQIFKNPAGAGVTNPTRAISAQELSDVFNVLFHSRELVEERGLLAG